MKFVDRSPEFARPERDSIFDRVQGSTKRGLSSPAECKAQQACIDRLARVLGDDYTLLQNVPLDHLEIPIPLILIGPAGLFIIQVATQTGPFLAKEDKWLSVVNPRAPHSVQPNLLLRAALMARAVDVYLIKQGAFAPKALPVLLCATPDMTVERIRPIARVVQADAIENFVADLSKGVRLIGPQILCELVEWMAPPLPGEMAALSGTPEVRPYVAPPLVEEEKLPGSEHRLKFAFSRGQQIALGVMVVLEVIALVIIVILVSRSLFP